MKKILVALALTALAGLASAQTYVTNSVPGGTFDPGFDTSYWTNNAANASTIFSYPTTGGNPNGYALMDSTAPGTGWGVFVGAVYDGSNSGQPIPLSSLGLAANVPCTVLMDMKIFSGAQIGGLKLESYNSSNIKISDTGDVKPSSGTGSWVTYSFPYTPAPGATGIKFVPLWGANSSVGYDNVRVVALTSLPLNAQITSPTNGQTVSTNYTINAAATVYPGAVTNVYFYNGATLLGSDDTAPFQLALTGATMGSAALKVVAKDDNGGSVTSAVVNVTVTNLVQQTIVKVDPSKPWLGYMNAFWRPDLGGAFDFGGAWGIADLYAAFSGVGSNSVLTLKPNPLNDPAAYWYDPPSGPGAVGTHDMEATMYVQPSGGTLNGNLVTFSGTCVSNTLVNPASTNAIGYGWTNYAFVKDFAPDYSSNVTATIALTSGVPFNVSLQTIADPARHIQYGFITRGPNVWPTDVSNYGSVVIQSLDASPTNVYVNNSSSWLGFMNVANTPQDTNAPNAYQFGSPWGTADLAAVFNGSGLVLSPNTIGDPAGYWYLGGGGPGAVGNKIMDASMYVEIGSFPGRNLTFSGTVLSNTLVSASNTNAAGNGWTSVAFIKDFAPDFSSVNAVTVPLTPGPFSLNLITINDPARHVQYGFQTIGPDVWFTDVAPFGNIVIGNVGTLPTTLNASRSGGNVNLSFTSQIGKTYSVQYKDNLTDTSWNNLLPATNGTGAGIVISYPATGDKRFYRLSIQ